MNERRSLLRLLEQSDDSGNPGPVELRARPCVLRLGWLLPAELAPDERLGLELRLCPAAAAEAAEEWSAPLGLRVGPGETPERLPWPLLVPGDYLLLVQSELGGLRVPFTAPPGAEEVSVVLDLR